MKKHYYYLLLIFFFLLFHSGCGSLGIIKERIPEPFMDSSGEWVFQLDSPSARIVYLAGDFNGWERPPGQRGIELKPGSDGIFKWKGKLIPGRYAYKYVIDNNIWILDPSNPRTVDDGRGDIRSLLIVTEK